VIWSDERVQGASRFVQRLWRLINESAEIAKAAPSARPVSFGADALAIRQAAHGALDKARAGSKSCISTSASPTSGNSPMRWARCWGARGSPPRSGMGCSRSRGHPGSFVRADDAASGGGMLDGAGAAGSDFRGPLAQIERDLLVEDTVTLVVQVNGKKRGEVTVARNAQNPEIEAAVLALDAVKQALGGKAVRKVIIVPMRIVKCRWLGPASPLGF